jgi:hypothetical protein
MTKPDLSMPLAADKPSNADAPRSVAAAAAAALMLAAALAGCSTSSAQTELNGAKPAGAQPLLGNKLLPTIGQAVKPAGRPGDAYQMTPAELALDCKKLTGKMQLRILMIRDQNERLNPSKTAQVTQKIMAPVFGGSSYGSNVADDAKRDRAWLEAYNAQLATKNCPTYNLDEELQPRSVRDTPTPVPSAAATGDKAKKP